jgi:hypothetical protein
MGENISSLHIVVEQTGSQEKIRTRAIHFHSIKTRRRRTETPHKFAQVLHYTGCSEFERLFLFIYLF